MELLHEALKPYLGNQKVKTKRRTFSFSGISFEVELDCNEKPISSSLERTGQWEGHQLSLYESLISPGDAFLDVGANVGVNSIFARMLKPDTVVVAVEPHPENFALLQSNFSNALGCNANQLKDKKVHLCPLAVSNRNGSVSITGLMTHAHIASDEEAERDGRGNLIAMQCMTLDDIVLQLKLENTPLSLVKIDVEGYTDLVISGGINTLKNSKNAIVEFSLGDTVRRHGGDFRKARRDSSDCFERLQGLFGADALFLSKRAGPVKCSSVEELFTLLALQEGVGDVLFQRTGGTFSRISPLECMAQNVFDLMRQNGRKTHQLIEIQKRLDHLTRE